MHVNYSQIGRRLSDQAIDLGCESTCRLLSSQPTSIAIYYYYYYYYYYY